MEYGLTFTNINGYLYAYSSDGKCLADVVVPDEIDGGVEGAKGMLIAGALAAIRDAGRVGVDVRLLCQPIGGSNDETLSQLDTGVKRILFELAMTGHEPSCTLEEAATALRTKVSAIKKRIKRGELAYFVGTDAEERILTYDLPPEAQRRLTKGKAK